MPEKVTKTGDLLDFLASLTDETFVADPRFAAPTD